MNQQSINLLFIAFDLLLAVGLMIRPAIQMIEDYYSHSDLYNALNFIIKPHWFHKNLINQLHKKPTYEISLYKNGYWNQKLTSKGNSIIQNLRSLYKKSHRCHITFTTLMMGLFSFVVSWIILVGPEALETDNLSTKAAEHLNSVYIPPATTISIIIGILIFILYGVYMNPYHRNYNKALTKEVKHNNSNSELNN